jgi:hypothetical protein
MRLIADDVARAILGRDDSRLAQVIDWLRSPAADHQQILSELAGDPRESVRGWVVWFARSHPLLLSEELLEKLSKDVDVDIRIDARRALLARDPGHIKRLASIYVAALASPSPVEVNDAIWQLVRYRVHQGLEPLRRLGDDPSVDRVVRNSARVAMLVLTGGEEQLVWGLQQHSHGAIELWIKGLAYLGTANAIAALEEFAHKAPDEECRAKARTALSAKESVSPRPTN